MEEATHETIARNLPRIGALDFQIMHDVTRGALPLYDSIVKEGAAPIVTINVFPLVRHTGGMAHLYQQARTLSSRLSSRCLRATSTPRPKTAAASSTSSPSYRPRRWKPGPRRC